MNHCSCALRACSFAVQWSILLCAVLSAGVRDVAAALNLFSKSVRACKGELSFFTAAVK